MISKRIPKDLFKKSVAASSSIPNNFIGIPKDFMRQTKGFTKKIKCSYHEFPVGEFKKDFLKNSNKDFLEDSKMIS